MASILFKVFFNILLLSSDLFLRCPSENLVSGVTINWVSSVFLVWPKAEREDDVGRHAARGPRSQTGKKCVFSPLAITLLIWSLQHTY